MIRPDPSHLILPACVVAILPALAWLTMGRLPLMVFAFAFGGGFLLYAATLWRRRIDAPQIIVPYLLTVMLFILHVGEEYLTDFELTVSKINGAPVPEEGFMLIAAFLAPIMWIGGAIAVLKNWRFGDYFLCTFFFAMILAELSHFAFPFVVDGTFHYESGMWTAALPLIPAVYGLNKMMHLMRQSAAGLRNPAS